MQAQPAVKKKVKSVSYSHWGYIFIAPFFITFLIFGLYPILFTFKTSVTDAVGWEKILNNNIIGFENFAQIFTSGTLANEKFWGALGNTIIIWFFNFVPQLGLALILASWFTDTRMMIVFPMEPQNLPYTTLLGSNSCLKFSNPTYELSRTFVQPTASVMDVLKVKKIGYSWKIRNTIKNGAMKKYP